MTTVTVHILSCPVPVVNRTFQKIRIYFLRHYKTKNHSSYFGTVIAFYIEETLNHNNLFVMRNYTPRRRKFRIVRLRACQIPVRAKTHSLHCSSSPQKVSGLFGGPLKMCHCALRERSATLTLRLLRNRKGLCPSQQVATWAAKIKNY